MTHTLIEEGVDIEKYPDSIFSLDESHEITLGDLHGNALKFFFILVKNGIIRVKEDDFYYGNMATTSQALGQGGFNILA